MHNYSRTDQNIEKICWIVHNYCRIDDIKQISLIVHNCTTRPFFSIFLSVLLILAVTLVLFQWHFVHSITINWANMFLILFLLLLNLTRILMIIALFKFQHYCDDIQKHATVIMNISAPSDKDSCGTLTYQGQKQLITNLCTVLLI